MQEKIHVPDIDSYADFENFTNNKVDHNIRIYLNSSEINSYDFFAIRSDLNKNISYKINEHDFYIRHNLYQLYLKTSVCNIDGFFLVFYENNLFNLEVLSISSTTVFAKIAEQKVNIPTSRLKVYGKLVNFIELPDNGPITITGIFR